MQRVMQWVVIHFVNVGLSATLQLKTGLRWSWAGQIYPARHIYPPIKGRLQVFFGERVGAKNQKKTGRKFTTCEAFNDMIKSSESRSH